MPSTETILAGLLAERAEHLAAGRLVEVQRVDQAVIAHQTMARLRQQRSEYAGDAAGLAGIEEQIRYWRGLVDLDADDHPATGATVEPATAEPAAAPAGRRRVG